jgi:hypothetical protein
VTKKVVGVFVRFSCAASARIAKIETRRNSGGDYKGPGPCFRGPDPGEESERVPEEIMKWESTTRTFRRY